MITFAFSSLCSTRVSVLVSMKVYGLVNLKHLTLNPTLKFIYNYLNIHMPLSLIRIFSLVH